jgi:hypothetical protein
MIKDKELYEKLKLMEDDKCLITLMQIDKKIPCLDNLVTFCKKLFANKLT